MSVRNKDAPKSTIAGRPGADIFGILLTRTDTGHLVQWDQLPSALQECAVAGDRERVEYVVAYANGEQLTPRKINALLGVRVATVRTESGSAEESTRVPMLALSPESKAMLGRLVAGDRALLLRLQNSLVGQVLESREGDRTRIIARNWTAAVAHAMTLAAVDSDLSRCQWPPCARFFFRPSKKGTRRKYCTDDCATRADYRRRRPTK